MEECKALVVDWQSKYYELKDEFDNYMERNSKYSVQNRRIMHRLASNFEQHILQHHLSFAAYLIEQAEQDEGLI